MKKLLLIPLFFLFALLIRNADANPFEYTWQELAPGVWAAIRQDPFELPQEGNAVFVVTDQGVVLFDAGGSPLMGESIVEKVRSVSNQPITHVIISHWHGDHMRGLQSIQAAFPNVQIFTHPHSRERIVTTQEKWLKRRVSMVPNIVKAVNASLNANQDLSGRTLIDPEKAWLKQGLTITDQLDKENNRTAYVIPNRTFENMTLYMGNREIQFFCPGKAHTAGDIIMWLPQEKIVATGDIVTAPIPLMPSAYTNDYISVLNKIKDLGFTALVPGHGAVQHDSQYIDLLAETIQTVSAQMKSLIQKGVSQDDAVSKIDFSSVEPRFTHGDPFLTNRFHDYVAIGLPSAAYVVGMGKDPDETF